MKIFETECSCGKKLVIHPMVDIKSVFSLYSGVIATVYQKVGILECPTGNDDSSA